MSYYGNKTFVGYFSVHKTLLQEGKVHRFSAGKPLVAYKVTDGSEVEVALHASGVKVIDTTGAECVGVQLIGIRPGQPSVFDDIQLVSISESYQLEANKYLVILEGTAVCEDTTYDSSSDLQLILGGVTGKTLTGNCKVVVFSHTS